MRSTRPEGEEPWGGSESRLPTAVRQAGRVTTDTRPGGVRTRWGESESKHPTVVRAVKDNYSSWAEKELKIYDEIMQDKSA